MTDPAKIQQKPRDRKTLAIQIGVLLLMIAFSIFVYFIRDQVQTLQRLGYPGIFVLNLLASGSIAVPIPALPIVSAMAAVKHHGVHFFDPFWLGAAAGLGATLGELSGYAAGLSGKALIENSKIYDRLHDWTNRYGVLTIVVIALIPNPFFDFAGIAAGTLRMSLFKFLGATLIGKLLKMWAITYGTFFSVGWITYFLQ